MSDWTFLNAHRCRVGFYGSDSTDGFNGMFEFALPGEPRRIRCIASDCSDMPDGTPKWQHVSVSFGPDNKRAPSWELMCRIKDLFWEPEEAVIQIHPPKSDYVNNHPGCLHLWRCLDEKQPLPPGIFVGIKALGTL